VVPSTRGGDDVFKRDVRGVLRHAHQRHGCCGARGGAQAMRRQMTSVLKPRDGPVLYTSRLQPKRQSLGERRPEPEVTWKRRAMTP